jgi:molybdate transport system substrate-binding protein
MKKKNAGRKGLVCLAVLLMLAFTLAGCGGSGDAAGADGGSAADVSAGPVEVLVFAAASMQSSLEELEAAYEAAHPDVDIILNCDSSGTLKTQILEGAPCDIFFSAAQAQMNEVEEAGMVIEGSRADVLNNQLVVITQPDSATAVTGIEDLDKAGSLALADGSVPVGKYTRRALMNLGLLDQVDDPAVYTTQEVSDALGGVEISEQGNVSKVLTAVAEGSSEVGTVYLSDTYGHENEVKILQTIPYDIAGDIIYPIALISNPDASEAQQAAAADVLAYFTGDEAKAVYETHLFDIDL